MESGWRSRPRHGRQVRLPEVGEAGQRRIESATAAVGGDGLAAWVTVRYLVGAGVRRLEVASDAVATAGRAVDAEAALVVRPRSGASPGHDEAMGALGLRDPAARAVAEGALEALAVLRAALDGAPMERPS